MTGADPFFRVCTSKGDSRARVKDHCFALDNSSRKSIPKYPIYSCFMFLISMHYHHPFFIEDSLAKSTLQKKCKTKNKCSPNSVTFLGDFRLGLMS